MEILFNKKGTPLMMSSTKFFAQTFTDAATSKTFAATAAAAIIPNDDWQLPYLLLGDYKVACWGRNNRFPQFAGKVISETTVLNSGLRFLHQLILGQGIFGCTVEGFDDRGNEILRPIDDKRLINFLESRMVRKYCEKILRDYLKYGNGAVRFLPDVAGRVAFLVPMNAMWYRYTLPDELGNQRAIVSGDWPLMPMPDQYRDLPVLPEWNPEGRAELLAVAGEYKKGFVYAVRDGWSNEEIYGEPRWWPAFVAGWIEIAHLVPEFLKKAYKNQTTWKWHVQIPYSYWDRKFPENEFESVEERKAAINRQMDDVERNLLGPENAEKPLFTNYAVNDMNGRIEEEWKIKALENKYTGNENLVTSSAANSEILFALMVNPNVMGAGMPGGAYSMNQGGSNIREAFLVNIANAWNDRQNLLDPLELYIRMNGLPECQLRFRSTILTTLDTGAGTKKVLS